MRRSSILYSGHFLPDRTVSNQDLCEFVGCDPEAILFLSKVKERRYVGDQETGVSLCQAALDKALEGTAESYSDIQFIICSTTCPDYQFPGNSAFLQERLGLDGCAIMDLRNQATGFLSALQVADAYIASGMYERILVAGSDVFSPGLDFSEAGIAVTARLGDGAGVAVVGPSEGGREIMAVATYTDARHARAFWNPSGSIHIPRITVEDLEKGLHYHQADWDAVRSLAGERVPSVIREACGKTGIAPEDLAILFIPQADRDLAAEITAELGLDEDMAVTHLERLGDTGAGSGAIALDEAMRSGRLSSGDCLCVATFGSGFSCAAAVIRF